MRKKPPSDSLVQSEGVRILYRSWNWLHTLLLPMWAMLLGEGNVNPSPRGA